jgi:hypothetical protein
MCDFVHRKKISARPVPEGRAEAPWAHADAA